MNTFVIFFARVVGYFVDKTLFRTERGGVGPGFYITVIDYEIVFGILSFADRCVFLAPARVPR